MERYKEVFPVDENTIFAYGGDIYTNTTLPDHLVVHEEVHLKQQEDYGLEIWVNNFLTNSVFRLMMEAEAYQKQLRSIKNKEFRNKVYLESVLAISSPLYGNMISKQDAMRLLLT